MDMNWRHFIGASILAGGLVVKAGAPLEAVAAGVALAAVALAWRRRNRLPTPGTMTRLS
jgi:hypothetical protein